MGTFKSSASTLILTDVKDGIARFAPQGTKIEARDAVTLAALPQIVVGDGGTWAASYPDVDLIQISDPLLGGWSGPIESNERILIARGGGSVSTSPTPTTGLTVADVDSRVAAEADLRRQGDAALSAQIAALPTGGTVSGGSSQILVWRSVGGVYPALPDTRPSGVQVVQAYGATPPTAYPPWAGVSDAEAIVVWMQVPA